MIRKFARVPECRIVSILILTMFLAGATIVCAQQTPTQPAPAQQAPGSQPPSAAPSPDNQQSGSQEPAPEEEIPGRKVKPREYKNWSFSVGGGASVASGTTKTYVRSGGGVAAAGVARNYSKYFGIRADFQFDNLPLRSSALQLAQAPGASSHVYSFTLDPIINIPVTKVWGGYILGGASFYHRTGDLDSSTAIPGSACNGFWSWWGTCFNGSLPLARGFLKANQNEFGENFGGGITRKIRPFVEIYGEFRYMHGKNNNITTDFHPITIGVRW